MAVIKQGTWNLILIEYVQTKPPLKSHADVSSRSRGLNIGLRFQLHPYLVYVISECSGKSVYWRELA